MYRAGIESILGFRLKAGFLALEPCIPAHWPRFEITFKYRSADYDIVVENPRGVGRGVTRIELDAETLPAGSIRIPLVDDGRSHKIRVTLG